MSFVQKHYLYFILSFFAVSRKWVIPRPLMLCICFFTRTSRIIYPSLSEWKIHIRTPAIWQFHHHLEFFHQGNQKAVERVKIIIIYRNL